MHVHLTEMPVTLHLSDRARATLTERAAKNDQDIAAIASELIEQAIARPPVDEALAPFRKQVADKGMTDDELDTFFHNEIEAHRREKKANSR